MAEINVTELSNTDLRNKLISLGQIVGPITDSTRRIFEKKLSKYLEENLNLNGKDDDDVTITKTVPKPSRASRKSLPRKFAPISSDEEEANSHPENFRRTIPNEPISTRKEFVDPNDIIMSRSTSLTATSVKSHSNNSRKSMLTSRTITSENGSNSCSSGGDLSSTRNPIALNSTYTSPSRNEFSDDELVSKTLKDKSEDTKKTKENHCERKENSSHLPCGTIETDKVVPSHKPSKTPAAQNSHANNKNKNIKLPDMQDEINESLKQLRKTFSSKRPSPNSKRACNNQPLQNQSEEEEIEAEFVAHISWWRQPTTWYRLFCFVLVIAIFVLCVCHGNIGNIPSISGKGSEKLQQHQFVNCLYQRLCVLAGDAECGYVKGKWIRQAELQTFAKPCFKGNNTTNTGNVNFTVYKDFIAMKEDGSVSSKFPYRSLICRISQAVSVVMVRVIIIITALVCGIAGYFFMKKRWADDDEQARQILHFVEKIIETLQRHNEICQSNKDIPPFLPIPHVRDMLIPPGKRKEMVKTWRKAVAFINSSDSRVRVETQRHAGEDFDVWRWIGVSTSNVKKEKKGTNETHLSNDHEKCWQGPAFDAIEKVVRMPIVTPTPCLKIRYMHEGLEEKGGNWVKRVENAVIEKCNKDGAHLLHIYVDQSSKEGCVYVKCDSLESAGKAFRSMYGNWFDSRLIIVKFVTMARYHQRFPDALKCVVPLTFDVEVPSSLNWVSEE